MHVYFDDPGIQKKQVKRPDMLQFLNAFKLVVHTFFQVFYLPSDATIHKRICKIVATFENLVFVSLLRLSVFYHIRHRNIPHQ